MNCLIAGQVNYVTGKPTSLWSNVLALPNLEVENHALSLRGRALEGAVLALAHLRKADFTGARLGKANFLNADLREASFECDRIGGWPGYFSSGKDSDKICVQLQSANLVGAQLQSANLVGAQLQGAILMDTRLQGANLAGAELQGATLAGARLQGSSLIKTQLQGAFLAGAQLQGANLDEAQLQGANLSFAQLQGASLAFTQAEGANFYGARLQSASLIKTQLQGVTLVSAELQGARLRGSFVWRTYPPSDTRGAFIVAPEPGPKYSGLNCAINECEWSEASYAALKLLIESSVPAGPQRVVALKQIAVLGKPPDIADEASAKAWMGPAETSALEARSYFDTLGKSFTQIGCAASGGPYVIVGLMRRQGPDNPVMLDRRFEKNSSQEAEVAAAFLDETKCPGARGLSEENKAELREIRDGAPPPPAAGAVSR